MKILTVISTTLVGITVFFSAVMPVYAESAPVYDADTLEQQFDNDQGPEFPLPPSPNQEGSDTSSHSDNVPAASVSSSSMGDRLRRVEQQINNMQSNDLSSRINALQSEVQSLRGQMEELMHEMQQLQNQQKTLYSDVDKRLSQQEKTKPSIPENDISSVNQIPTHSAQTDESDEGLTQSKRERNKRLIDRNIQKAQTENREAQEVSSSVGSQTDQPNVAEEQQIYQTAYNFIKVKKYNEAVNALQGMLKKYPSGQFASNAHYWLGELYGLMGKNEKALTEFNLVLKTYPRSPRVSDAQLKVGLIYASELNWANAKSAFKKVINRYPGTASARLASEQLKQIRQAGH